MASRASSDGMALDHSSDHDAGLDDLFRPQLSHPRRGSRRPFDGQAARYFDWLAPAQTGAAPTAPSISGPAKRSAAYLVLRSSLRIASSASMTSSFDARLFENDSFRLNALVGGR
jgi:hypothetical protein